MVYTESRRESVAPMTGQQGPTGARWKQRDLFWQLEGTLGHDYSVGIMTDDEKQIMSHAEIKLMCKGLIQEKGAGALYQGLKNTYLLTTVELLLYRW